MTCITLTNGHNQVKISLFGGHILSWYHSNSAILWLSELADHSGDSAIRGGVPICFPWFAERGVPKHGFARTQLWALKSQTDNQVLLELCDNESTRLIWPHQFKLTLVVSLTEKQLSISLLIENTDKVTWQCGGALHSYFSCQDARKVLVKDLKGVPFHNSLTLRQQRFETNCLPNPIDAIVPAVSSLEVELNENNSLDLKIEQYGNDSCVIWNPSEQHPKDISEREQWQFICFESAIAQTEVTILPGQHHQLVQTLTLIE